VRPIGWLLAGVVVITVFVVTAIVTILVTSPRPLFPGPQGPFRPEANPVGGYLLELSLRGNSYKSVSIGSQGDGCELLLPDSDANRTCLIATNLIPSLIGGEAYGQLNLVHTPAFDALVWRARANGDSGVCQRGGLEDDFLADCLRQALDIAYEYAGKGMVVRIPIGGALPSQSP
jgi:hypothetical protein